MSLLRGLFLLVACLGGGTVVVDASVFHGLSGLAPQPPSPSNPLIFSHNFSYCDWRGRTTTLHYNTEVSENVIKIIDLPPGMNVLGCDDDSVSLSLPTPGAIDPQLLQIGKILVGDRSSGCSNSTTSKPILMHRRITSVAMQADGASVNLTTVKAQIDEMLKNVDAHFHSHAFTAEDMEQQRSTATSTSTRRQKRQQRQGFFSWLGNAVEDVADAAADAVDVVAAAVTTLVTGDYQNSENLLGNNGDFSFNYDPSTQQAEETLDLVNLATGDADGSTTAGLSLQCTNCYATFSSSLDVSINIQSYALQLFSAALSATATANVEVTLSAQTSSTWQDSATIATIPGPDIDFDIGIPVTIELSFPLTAGYSVTLDAAAQATAYATATGSINYGVSYAAGKGWSPIESTTFAYTDGLSNVGGAVNGNAMIYIMPVVSISAYDSLTVGIGLAPYVNAGLQYNSNGFTASPSANLEISASYGLDTQFSASLSVAGMVQIASWTSPFYNLVSDNFMQSPYFYTIGAADGGDSGDGNSNVRSSGSSSTPSAAVALSVGSCVGNATALCNGRGMFDCTSTSATPSCTCFDGWTGPSCQTPPPKVVIQSPQSGNNNSMMISVPGDDPSLLAAGFCPSGQCTILQQSESLQTCAHLVGQAVCIPTDSVAAVDQAVGQELAVLAGVGPRCLASMRQHLCTHRFPSCNPSTTRITPVCFDSCVEAYTECDIPAAVSTKMCVAASSARNASLVAPATTGGSLMGCSSTSPTAQKTCMAASGLTTCTHLNGQNVAITAPMAFSSPADADAHVAALLNSASFGSDMCRLAALTYRCAQFLPLCGGDDAATLLRLPASTCLTMLSGCETYASGGCNASAAKWINDTVAPNYYSAQSTMPKSVLPAPIALLVSSDSSSSTGSNNNNGGMPMWKTAVIAAGSAVGGAIIVVVVVVIGAGKKNMLWGMKLWSSSELVVVGGNNGNRNEDNGGVEMSAA